MPNRRWCRHSNRSLFAGITVACVAFFAGYAHANTYNLTLTDPANSLYSGTGTLVIVGAPDPTNGYQMFCLNNSCGNGTLTSLSFTLNNGDTYKSSDSTTSGVSAVFKDGNLYSIGFYDSLSDFQFTITSNLNYTYHFYSPEFAAVGAISLAATATPLPGTLPLFVTGLAAIGLFEWRRRRTLAPGAAV